MAYIIRGTTPTIEFTFSEVDPAEIDTAIFTIKQHNEIMIERDLTTAVVGSNVISWTLTQEETLGLKGENITAMVNWTLPSGIRGASIELEIEMLQNHKNEVI